MYESYGYLRQRAETFFADHPRIRCPYFGTDIVLNSDGFHHLRYSARRERSKPEQMLKFRLLPLALEVIQRSGTIQEYRKIWQAIGKPGRDGMRPAKEVEYWGLVAIIGERPHKVRVVLRRVGTGNVTLWSVMRGTRMIADGSQKLAPEGIEEE